MELKMFVSGAPSGDGFWGEQADSAYLGTLYANSSVDRKFDIRIFRTGNKIYAYYHYLIYNCVNDYYGRSGSYFGLTIRLDSFCADFRTIYYALDIAFRNKIIGSILSETSGSRLQYICFAFSQCGQTFTELESFIRNLLGTSLNVKDFKSLNRLPQGHKVTTIHWNDVTAAIVLQAIGENGFCSISSEYESRTTQQLVQDAFQKGVVSRQDEIVNLNNKIQELNTLVQNQSSRMDDLEQRRIDYNNRGIRSAEHKAKPNKKYGKWDIIVWAAAALLVLSLLGYWGYQSFCPKQTTADSDGVDMVSSSSGNASFFEEAEKCPETVVTDTIVKRDEDNGFVTYKVMLKGLDELPEKQCLTSAGQIIEDEQENVYVIRECPQETDVTVVFVGKLQGDSIDHTLKKHVIRHIR